MSIFSSILHKIFHHADAAAVPASAEPSVPSATPDAAASAPTGTPAPSTQPASSGQTSSPSAALAQADVEAILKDLAAKKGGGGNWRTSIVDLLKLLDLDSSLNARKELASELNVHAGEHGSAEQNIALSKAVWQQLAKNGGKVPDSLKG